MDTSQCGAWRRCGSNAGGLDSVTDPSGLGLPDRSDGVPSRQRPRRRHNLHRQSPSRTRAPRSPAPHRPEPRSSCSRSPLRSSPPRRAPPRERRLPPCAACNRVHAVIRRGTLTLLPKCSRRIRAIVSTTSISPTSLVQSARRVVTLSRWGVSFGRRSPPQGGQYSTPNNKQTDPSPSGNSAQATPSLRFRTPPPQDLTQSLNAPEPLPPPPGGLIILRPLVWILVAVDISWARCGAAADREERLRGNVTTNKTCRHAEVLRARQ